MDVHYSICYIFLYAWKIFYENGDNKSTCIIVLVWELNEIILIKNFGKMIYIGEAGIGFP